MKSIYLLIGGPGSGKTSTLSEIESTKISHYSLGAEYRQLSQENSSIGKVIKQHIDIGQIVPLSIAKQVIEQFIHIGKDVIIIDGFPRSINQAKMFEEAIDGKARLCGVIELIVDEKEAFRRISKRSRGVDDDPKLFAERMRVYNNEIKIIRDYYKTQNIYNTVTSEANCTETARKLMAYLNL